MNKGVEKILLEEKEVFECNTQAIKSSLKESISSFIKKIRNDIDNKINLDKYFKEKIINIESNFINAISEKRNKILEDYIINHKVFSEDIRKDKDYINIINLLLFNDELLLLLNENNLKNNKENFKKYNLTLIKEVEPTIYKLFTSLIAYTKDITNNSLPNNISYTASIMMNTFYKELKKIANIESTNFIEKIKVYELEIIEALESIVPKKNLKIIKKYVEDNYLNITSSIYNRYITHALGNIHKIILGTKIDKLSELKCVELPFLEYISTLSKKRVLNNEEVINNFIFNLTIKVYNSYEKDDYENLLSIISPFLEEINNDLLESLDNISNIVTDVILKERKHLDDLLPKLEKITNKEIDDYFNNQKDNISLDLYRI